MDPEYNHCAANGARHERNGHAKSRRVRIQQRDVPYLFIDFLFLLADRNHDYIVLQNFSKDPETR